MMRCSYLSTRMVNVWKLVVTLAVAAVLLCTCVHGQVSTLNYTNFFDFGVDVGDTQLERLLDGSSAPINLSTPIQFFGRTQHRLFVNTNGIISFQLPFTEYIPRRFPLNNFIPLIAPFWNDVGITRSGNIFFRQRSNATLLQRACNQLQELFPSSANFTPTTLFIATWDRVPSLAMRSQANTFQAVIVANQQMTFVFFIYGDIQWGDGASIGFDAGDGTRFFMVPGALTNQTLNIDEGSNVDVTGLYIYRVDLCSVLGPIDAGCISLGHPLNGKVELYNTTVGSTASYTCNRRYSLSNGNNTLTCQANGQWSGCPPSCELNYTNFFDFGVDVGDTQLERFGRSSAPINLSPPIQYFGRTQHKLFVNRNGIISFQLPVTEFTPQRFPLNNFIPLIAPFWQHVDIRRSGGIFFRQTSNATLLQRSRNQMQELFPSSANFTPTTMFIATWDRVPSLAMRSQANTFQAVIVADQQMTFVFFIYGDIQWGDSISIGFDGGDGTRSFMVPGALTNQTLNIDEGSNVDVTGLYIYRVDLCSVLGPIDAGCISLGHPLNGKVELFNTTVGSTASYTCNRGFSLSNGNNTLTCQANGQWSGCPPSCKLNYTDFFDFGFDVGDAQLERLLDGSSPPINLSTPITFYGRTQHTLFVNTNGIISFQIPFTEFIPQRFPLNYFIPLIAPFWDDVDIRRFGNIFFRETSNTTLLQRACNQLQELFPSSDNFTPTTLFIATWDRVAPFGLRFQANTFQAVIVADQQMTFVFFIYGDIQWGDGANIGFDAGDGTRSFMVPHALTRQALNIDDGNNVGVTGLYIYRVDLCSVIGPIDGEKLNLLLVVFTIFGKFWLFE